MLYVFRNDGKSRKGYSTHLQVEEKIHKEKQMLRDSINTESLEINKRLDKINIDRMNDVADVQSKVWRLFNKKKLEHSRCFWMFQTIWSYVYV